MKKIRTIILLLLVTRIVVGYSLSINRKISKDLEIKLPKKLEIEWEDSHGGFHGDGVTLAKVRLNDKDMNKLVKSIQDSWNKTPITENIKLEFYGGKKDNMNYGSKLAKDLEMPEIKNGYWIFIDRHNQDREFTKGENLYPRYSANYSFGLVDVDTNILYYIKFDS